MTKNEKNLFEQKFCLQPWTRKNFTKVSKSSKLEILHYFKNGRLKEVPFKKWKKSKTTKIREILTKFWKVEKVEIS